MAGNLDKIKNGLLFGGIFGALALAYAKSAGSVISFLASGMTSLSQFLISQPWMSWLPASIAGYLDYILIIIFGAIVGAYIDKK